MPCRIKSRKVPLCGSVKVRLGTRQLLDILRKSKWLVTAALFAMCVGPTFISYQPYLFRWDDSDYLARSIASQSGLLVRDVHGLRVAMVSIHPPAMTLLGLPWGPLASWDAAGKCFITLAAIISLLAACCLYLLLRIGVKPFFLLVGSACVFASIGPYQQGGAAHVVATGFMSDSLFAWTSLAAVLLIPYEAWVHCPSIRAAVVRGLLWASILSLGALTKVSFFYFIVLIVPMLLLIRLRYAGPRSALAALIATGCGLAPSAIYFLRWGRLAVENGRAASYGKLAHFYYAPLGQFLSGCVRESPGLLLSLSLMVGALTYVLISGRLTVFRPDLVEFLIMIGFGIIVLAAPSRLIRYAFPAIVALPFLTAILISAKRQTVPVR